IPRLERPRHQAAEPLGQLAWIRAPPEQTLCLARVRAQVDTEAHVAEDTRYDGQRWVCVWVACSHSCVSFRNWRRLKSQARSRRSRSDRIPKPTSPRIHGTMASDGSASGLRARTPVCRSATGVG